jgi:hypothetical protein
MVAPSTSAWADGEHRALRTRESRVDLVAHLLEGRDVLAERRRELAHGGVHRLVHPRLVECGEQLLALGQFLLEQRRVLGDGRFGVLGVADRL